MSDSKNTKSSRGFGAMEDSKHREMSRQGGHAAARGNTSNRGFASMDRNKQREISSQGGKASQESRSQNADRKLKDLNQTSDYRGRNEDRLGVSGDTEASERELNALDDEDEVVAGMRAQSTYTETDEDEDEGLGDGKTGRSKDDPF